MFGRKKPTPKVRGMKVRETRYRNVTKKYPKSYTVKEWKRFSPDIQQELTNRYTVTISDYKTRGEKMKIVKSRFKSGLKKGVSEMGKMEMGSGKSVSYLDKPINIKSPNSLGMFDGGFKSRKSKNNFDNLTKFKLNF
jgi:hypothetical protein